VKFLKLETSNWTKSLTYSVRMPFNFLFYTLSFTYLWNFKTFLQRFQVIIIIIIIVLMLTSSLRFELPRDFGTLQVGPTVLQPLSLLSSSFSRIHIYMNSELLFFIWALDIIRYHRHTNKHIYKLFLRIVCYIKWYPGYLVFFCFCYV